MDCDKHDATYCKMCDHEKLQAEVNKLRQALSEIKEKKMYVYLNSEPALYTVGHYDPKGTWIAESDHVSSGEAARRVGYLNGATDQNLLSALEGLYEEVLHLRRQPSVKGDMHDPVEVAYETITKAKKIRDGGEGV